MDHPDVTIANFSLMPMAGQCGFCKKASTELPNPLRKCRGCGIAKYCSQECQKRAWPEHKKVCRDIKTVLQVIRLRPSSDPRDLEGALRAAADPSVNQGVCARIAAHLDGLRAENKYVTLFDVGVLVKTDFSQPPAHDVSFARSL